MGVTYLPVLVAIAAGLGLAGGMLLLKSALGPRKPSAIKSAPFECGSEPVGTPRVRFSVQFYQVAILFLVFDIETAFLYPWAVLFRELGAAGLAAMLVFLAVLAAALVYVWKKGALDWGEQGAAHEREGAGAGAAWGEARAADPGTGAARSAAGPVREGARESPPPAEAA